MRRATKVIAIAALVILGAMQAIRVPRENPKISPAMTLGGQTTVPADVRSILDRSCIDCHSNRTDWEWYSYISPVMWLQAADVYAGRSHMNLSEWGKYGPDEKADRFHHICEMVTEGEMPLWFYQPLHPHSYLSQSDVDTLCQWAHGEEDRLKSAAHATTP